MSRSTVTSILAACLLTSAAAAQPAPQKAPQKAPAQTKPANDAAHADDAADAAPLRGPAVDTTAKAAPSLVQRDFAGRIVKLDIPPAEAAAKLMTLDDDARAQVDRILLERSRILDKIVTDNLELLVRLQGAREGGEREEVARVFQELSAKAQPLRDRGQLAQELLGVLPDEQGRELRRLMQEYWQAIVKQELDDKKNPGGVMDDAAAPAANPRRDNREVMRQEMLAVVGGEIRRAYERTIGSAARDFDTLLAELNVTPEQESRIRKIVGDSFQASYGKATVQERTAVFAKVYEVLDEQQKTEVIRRLGPHGQR